VAVTAVTAGAAAAAAFPGLAAAAGGGIGGGLGVLASGAAGLAGVGISAGAAALGSIVSQGFGVATGIQQSFSWKAVALAGISAGVTAGINASGVFSGIASTGLRAGVSGAAASAISQGIGVVTGLQNKFDWAGVAAAGVSAGVGASVGKSIGALPIGVDKTLANYGLNAVADMAASIASAATRSVINGTDFGDNLMGALPDAIGGTIGNMLAIGVTDPTLEDADESSFDGNVFFPEHSDDVDSPLLTPAALGSPKTAQEIYDDKLRAVSQEAINGFDKQIGTDANGKPLMEHVPGLRDFNVDWGKISFYEDPKGPTPVGYVPGKGKQPIDPKSGVTIASGFDIGHYTPDQIRAMHLPVELTAKLLPYAAYGPGKFRMGMNAEQTRLSEKKAGRELRLNDLELHAIDAVVMVTVARAVNRLYSRNGANFLKLPRAAQTAIMDVGFNSGAGFGYVAAAQRQQVAAHKLKSVSRDALNKEQLWSLFKAQQWAGTMQPLQQLGATADRTSYRLQLMRSLLNPQQPH